MIINAGTAKRLRRKGGTLYTVPSARPKAYSRVMRGPKLAAVRAKPPAARPAHSSHASAGLSSPAAVDGDMIRAWCHWQALASCIQTVHTGGNGQERFVDDVDVHIKNLVDAHDVPVATEQRQHTQERPREKAPVDQLCRTMVCGCACCVAARTSWFSSNARAVTAVAPRMVPRMV